MFHSYSKPWRIGHLKGESDGKEGATFLDVYLEPQGQAFTITNACFNWMIPFQTGWLGFGYKFHETLRPFFAGIHGNPFKTWSPRSNTNFDKSWMFWSCHDASVDIFMFFTAPKPVGVPYEKKKTRDGEKSQPLFGNHGRHPNWKVQVYVMIHSLISIFHYLRTSVV